MSVTLCAGPAREVAAALVAHLCTAARGDPWAGHTVLVPSARAAEILALGVAAAGGALGLEILTPPALAGRILGPDAVRPIADGERLLVMTAVVRTVGWPKPPPSLAGTLLALRDELALAGATPDDALRTGAIGDRAARALRAFDRAIGERPSTPDSLRLAAQRVRARRSASPPHLDLWAFTDVTGAEAALVAALALSSDVGAYLPARAAAVADSPAARRLTRALGLPPLPVVEPLAPAALVAVDSATAEADSAARLVIALAAEVPLHRIACVGPSMALGRVEERLIDLGVPVRRCPSALAEGAAGAVLGLLVELWAEDRAESLAALLAAPGGSLDARGASALADRLLRTPGASASARLHIVAEDGTAGAAAEMAILLRQRLGALAHATTWAAWAEAAREALEELLDDALEAREAEAVWAALGRIADLDRCEGLRSVPAPTAALARACLDAELSGPLPPATLGHAPVELLAFEEAGALTADAVVLFGVAAEDVGATAADASLLAEEGRRILAQGGWPADGPDDRALTRMVAAAVARAGAERVAAVFVAQGRTGDRPVAALVEPARLAPVPDGPLDVIDSRRAVARGRTVDATVWHGAARSATGLGPPARALLAAASALPTAWDGQVPPSLASAPAAGWSATLLEAYARCPYQDFLARLLDMDETEVKDALDDAEPGPAEIGQIAHTALERMRRAARAEGREPLRAADMPWLRERLGEALDNAFAQLPSTPLGPVHRSSLADELSHAAWLAIRAGDLVTLDSEWSFGPHGQGAFVLALADGRRVPLRGRVDRVAEERQSDGRRGHLRVIDYKSGRSLPKPAVAPDNLQLALYMLAVADAWQRELAEVDGAYVSVTARGGFRESFLPGERLAREREALERAVAQILDGMAAGRFGPAPKGGEHCRTCRFRPVCPGDIAERARRKGLDPQAGGASPPTSTGAG